MPVFRPKINYKNTGIAPLADLFCPKHLIYCGGAADTGLRPPHRNRMPQPRQPKIAAAILRLRHYSLPLEKH